MVGLAWGMDGCLVWRGVGGGWGGGGQSAIGWLANDCPAPHPSPCLTPCLSFCRSFAARPQEEQHAKILPAVMGLMDDFANPRVQAHACAAVVNFAGAF